MGTSKARGSRTAKKNADSKREAEPEKVLVLRTCAADMSAYNGFKWPESGPVECSDWKSYAECGNGLHGWLWGEGDAATSRYVDKPDSKWLVVEVLASDVVDLQGKVKFPRGVVVHCGTKESATAYLSERAAGRVIIGATSNAGDSGTATAGYAGTATAGYAGTATAGTRGTATAGDLGTLQLKWWDGVRYRIATFYVGEDGIEPNVPYKLDENRKPVKAK